MLFERLEFGALEHPIGSRHSHSDQVAAMQHADRNERLPFQAGNGMWEVNCGCRAVRQTVEKSFGEPGHQIGLLRVDVARGVGKQMAGEQFGEDQNFDVDAGTSHQLFKKHREADALGWYLERGRFIARCRHGFRIAFTKVGGADTAFRGFIGPQAKRVKANEMSADTLGVKANVLVIEDSESVRRLIEVCLRVLDVELRAAEDGIAGLNAARTHLPDVIVLDIGLPGMDGWEVLRRLRSDEATRLTKVLILTAHVQPEVADKAQADGADAFMTKPFRPIELREQIEKLLVL